MSAPQKQLVASFVEFLQKSTENGTVSSDDSESVQFAIDCLKEVFHLSGQESTVDLENLVAKSSAASTSTKTTTTNVTEVSDEDKKKAEQLKSEGNRAVAQREYKTAVEKYSEAIKLNPSNAIYFSNRAAAHSGAGDHASAIEDAQQALSIDPEYTKAYSRLGLAYFALGKPQESMDAYKTGLDKEGDKASDAMRKGYETAKKRVEEQLDAGVDSSALDATSTRDAADDSASSSSLPGMGAGGFPDFSSLMNNPQIAQMAQNLMSNPGALSGLMNNPALKDMAKNMQNGGGMPNMGDLMNNPALQDLAKNFMGGGQK